MPIYDAAPPPFVRPSTPGTASAGTSALDAYDAFRASRNSPKKIEYRREQPGAGRIEVAPSKMAPPSSSSEMAALQVKSGATL